MSDSLIIIPTYNEKENIEKIICKVFSLEKSFHILIVDDGSPDGTGNIVKNLQSQFDEQLHIEERTGKLGSRNSLYSRVQMGIAKKLSIHF